MNLKPNEITVDSFCGGGGASTGLEQFFGRPVDIAINHDEDAIDMHRLNHPYTKHYNESVWDVDPVEACAGRPVGAAWFSPDCKHFSKAKGGKPVDKNIRGLAWVTVKWAALVPMRVFFLENVEEFETWGPLIEVKPGEFIPDPERKGETFEAFVACLTTGLPAGHPAWKEIKATLGEDFPYWKLERGLGYNIEHKVLVNSEFGVPTIRKRLFMVGRNDGHPICWPEVSHGENLTPMRTAADIIDWSIPVKTIFGRKRPLAEKTMARIAKGLKKFVFDSEDPFVAPDACQVPFITEHANGSSQRNMAANEPLRTLCAQTKGGHFALVTAFIAKHYGGVTGSDIKQPLHTVTTKDHNALVSAKLRKALPDKLVTSHMIKMRGTNLGHPTDEPIHTVSAGGNHVGEVRAFLIKYYGTSYGCSIADPVHTLTTKSRFGLVTLWGQDYEIIDIGMRMLEPHELFMAHDFPSDYIIDVKSDGSRRTKKDQVARVGNSVPPTMSRLLAAANFTPPNTASVSAA